MRLLAALLVIPSAFAQTPYDSAIRASPEVIENAANRGAPAVWQSLQKLHTRASLIMITAHPDDEDGGMLAWASRGLGARVALLTLNRGEGGANVMSSDYFDALGLIRTQELLAAGRYYGVDQYWTRMVDYGFSKTLDESLKMWGHDNVLRDVVRVIRLTRPLVVTSVFVGAPSDGHGNHQTAGLMAKEAMDAAGDPTRFPDLIQQGLRPWLPLKQYAHVPFFGPEKGSLRADVEVPEGDYNPLLGLNYTQLAHQGLNNQKSQNGGSAIPAAREQNSAYHRFASKVPVPAKENSFFDGIDTSLAGIASLVKTGDAAFLRAALRDINADVEKAIDQFSAAHPETISPMLASGLKRTVAVIDHVYAANFPDTEKSDVLHELEIKRAQFNNALAESLGVSMRATVVPDQPVDPLYLQFAGDPETFTMGVPGQRFKVNIHVAGQSTEPVTLLALNCVNTDGNSWQIEKPAVAAKPLQNAAFVDSVVTVTAAPAAKLTKPYFSREGIGQTFYRLDDAGYVSLPSSPYPLEAWARFEYQGAQFQVGRVVQSVKRVTGYGTVFEPLTIGPALSVSLTPRASVVDLNARSFPVSVSVRSNGKPSAGSARLSLPAGWRSEPAEAAFTMAQDSEERTLAFRVTPDHLEPRPYTITAVARYAGREYSEGYQVAGYPGLRPSLLYTPATSRVSGADVKVAPGLEIGYIMGSGDDVPDAIKRLGAHVTELDASTLASGNLGRFQAILLGVRTYAVREDLKRYNARLLDYVKNGGVVIVQYNTPEFDHNYGPYPYVMSDDPEEVTDEASKVEILNGNNPIFQWPNRITPQDFEGWVEERGSKFLKSWDPRYEALLSTQDAGQEPQKGGLLFARFGKGIWIYNAYAFYRELPEGVPGAYRLFANLISLARNPHTR